MIVTSAISSLYQSTTAAPASEPVPTPPKKKQTNDAAVEAAVKAMVSTLVQVTVDAVKATAEKYKTDVEQLQNIQLKKMQNSIN